MIRSLGDKIPKIAESVFVSEAAYIIGNVEIGENCSVFPGAVIRGDFGPVRIGKNTHIEDNVVIHCVPYIGDNVIFGHGSVINAQRIGNNVLIGMNATIMHDVEIDDFCLIAGGAVVVEGMKIPGNSFVAGVPAKIQGEITTEQSQWLWGAQQMSKMVEEYKKQGL
jgi:carbonic anhydrase/acetyltransferase-like protein (isoleucine patch superfamily)